MANEDLDPLLDILQAHGQQFLESFLSLEPSHKKRKRFYESDNLNETCNAKAEECEDYEDWQGFSQGCSEHESIDSQTIENGIREGFYYTCLSSRSFYPAVHRYGL